MDVTKLWSIFEKSSEIVKQQSCVNSVSQTNTRHNTVFSLFFLSASQTENSFWMSSWGESLAWEPNISVTILGISWIVNTNILSEITASIKCFLSFYFPNRENLLERKMSLTMTHSHCLHTDICFPLSWYFIFQKLIRMMRDRWGSRDAAR